MEGYTRVEMMVRIGEARADGFIDGRLERNIELICRKLKKGKAPEEIARDLEEDNIDEVQRICDIAEKYAPGYDVERVYEKCRALYIYI